MIQRRPGCRTHRRHSLHPDHGAILQAPRSVSPTSAAGCGERRRGKLIHFQVTCRQCETAGVPLFAEAKNSRPILWIIALALVLRAALLARIDPVAIDSALYFEIARFIEGGNWTEALDYVFPPLYPALIAPLTSLGVNIEAAGILVSFSATVLALIPLWSITRALAGESAALWAAFLWAIHPYAVRLSVRALSDGPTALFVALSLWAGLRALRGGRSLWLIGSGALAGLAYLSRPEGIEPVLGLALACVLWSGNIEPSEVPGGASSRSPATPWSRRVAGIGALLIGWALVAAPYIAAISLEAGTITFSKKKSPAAMVRAIGPSPQTRPAAPANPPQTAEDPAERNSAQQTKTGRLWTAARNIYIFQQPLLNGIHLIVILPALLALRFWKPNREARQEIAGRLLVSLTLLHVAVLIGLAAQLGPSYLGGHHVFLMVLYLLPFAGAGLAGALDRLREKIPGANWAAPFVIALFIAVTLPSSVFRRPESGAVYRAAGLWIAKRAQTRPTVVTHSAKLAYHAGARRVAMAGDSNRTIERARALKADFIALVADGRETTFQPQVDSGALEVAALLSERSGSRTYRVMIYRLRAAPSSG